MKFLAMLLRSLHCGNRGSDRERVLKDCRLANHYLDPGTYCVRPVRSFSAHTNHCEQIVCFFVSIKFYLGGKNEPNPLDFN